MTLRVVIVDDEELARDRVKRLVERDDDVDVVGVCENGRDAIMAIHEQRPDVVFLDVRMPGLDGFDVVRALAPDEMPIIVFVTAYDEHAVRAFDVHALDYLVKPVEPDRLAAAVERARTRLRQSSAAERFERIASLVQASGMTGGAAPGAVGVRDAESYAERGTPDRLLIKTEGRMLLLSVTDIDWIEAVGNYARVHVRAQRHLVRETMGRLDRRLAAAGFARIHRSTIVNLDRVREIQPWFNGEYVVLLADGTKFKLSRFYRDKLETRLGR